MPYFLERTTHTLIKIAYNILTLSQHFIPMFSIFKRKSNKPEVPEWASFFTPEEYDAFIKSIQSYFSEKGVTYEFGNNGTLQTGPNDFGFKTLGLMNAAQTCKQNELSHYHEIVSSYFDAISKTFAFEKEFQKIITDYEKVEQYICIKIYPYEYFAPIGVEFTISQNIVDDLFALLMFDLPDTVVNIKPEQAAHWNKTNEELFEKAKENSRNNYQFHLSKEKLGNTDIWFIGGGHNFVPNILFELAHYPQLVGSKGALIGIPHRECAIFYMIDSLEVTSAINSLIPTIYGMDREGPGSISNKLLWYRDGKFENQPYKIVDNTIEFYPTENFLEMLNSMEE